MPNGRVCLSILVDSSLLISGAEADSLDLTKADIFGSCSNTCVFASSIAFLWHACLEKQKKRQGTCSFISFISPMWDGFLGLCLVRFPMARLYSGTSKKSLRFFKFEIPSSAS